MPERTPLLAANWKLNHDWESSQEFIDELRELCPEHFDEDEEPELDLLICPPGAYLGLLGGLLEDSTVFLGGQDVSRYNEGAYTGDVSAHMLADVGCDYCIVGHSERRNVFGDTDEMVSDKLARLREAELLPILCIGENLEVREGGRAVESTLGQLEAVKGELKQIPPGMLVIAYEPIWAIGTGKNAEPGDAQEMAAAIRGWLKQHLGAAQGAQALILYGGSVKPDNCAGYFAAEDIDGALVGGASLKAESFAKLAEELDKQL